MHFSVHKFTVHIRLADHDLPPFARFHPCSMVRLHCRPVWRRDRYSAVGWGMAMVQKALVALEPPIAYSQWPFERSNSAPFLLPIVQACMDVKFGIEEKFKHD